MDKQDLIDFVSQERQAWEAGLIKAPVHLCGGNENDLINLFKEEIKPHDYILSSHRNTYHALLAGTSPIGLMEEICGNASGTCLGRARSMGFIDVDHNFYASAIVGGMCGIGVGIAWGLKKEQETFNDDPLNTDEFSVRPIPAKVWCFVGDGVLDGGHFWEALQYAEGWDLPIVFIIEDNDRATCTAVKDRMGRYNAVLFERIVQSPKCRYYTYRPTYPHVGSGKYVAF